MQLSQYPQSQSFRPSNPYQQLRYLYQTENYHYFFELLNQLKGLLKENRNLKNSIFEELNYLQLTISSRSDKEGLIASSRSKEANNANEIGLLKYKFDVQDLNDTTKGEIGQSRLLNTYLKKLLDDKIAYNKQLLQLINEYQMSIMMIIKNLYKLFGDQTNDIRKKLEVLQNLRLQVMKEFNQKILKLEKLSQLNDVLLS